MSPAKKLAIVVAFQLLVLFSIIGFKQYTVVTGETVLLKVQPIDPRGLLGGNSADVQFDISRLTPGVVVWDDDAPRCCQAPVYVELQRQDDGYWTAIAVHGDRTHARDGTELIRGTVQSTIEPYSRMSQPLDIRYGFEQIFIPEGDAGGVPFGTSHTVAVAVKVDRFGNAVPRYFLVDGARLDLERR
jgi:uncharacterized membrane-anchored protein